MGREFSPRCGLFAVLALVGALACVTAREDPSAQPTRVVAEPAYFAGVVQVLESDGTPHVILSTATRDVVARGALVDRLAELEGRHVRVRGRWIDTGPVPVMDVDQIDAPPTNQ